MSDNPNPATNTPFTHNTLPIGTRIGEFEITGLVGVGGFGIVYQAMDHSLHRQVALKEYMPTSLAQRAPDGSVSILSETQREAFEAGRNSFVNEARLLAQFDHPSLVKVYRFWQAGNTAYMVMPLYVGKTLRQVLAERPELDEAWIRKFLAPVMSALEVIHHENCFHRDISPDNIMLLEDDRPVLLDFGAARRVIGDMTQALTVFVKHSYAPVEQYAEMPGMQQGAWTDIYTLAALVYLMITRKLPPPSVSRIVADSYEPLTTLAAGAYGEPLLAGLDICLRVRPEQRPQSIAEMRTLLGIRSGRRRSARPESAQATAPASPRRVTTSSGKHSPADLSSARFWRGRAGLSIGVALIAVLALGGLAYSLGLHSAAARAQSAPAAVSSPSPAVEQKLAHERVLQPAASTPLTDESSPRPAKQTKATEARHREASVRKQRGEHGKPGSTRSDNDSSSGSRRRKASGNDSGGIGDAAKDVAHGAKKAASGVADWAKRTFGGK